jgi:Ca2+/Na+ antiporter
VEAVGQVLFYAAIAAGGGAAAIWISGLVWMVVAAIRKHGARRPMFVNHAALAFRLAVPVMVVGLVMLGRLDWWFVLLFAPFVALRFILFRAGTSISRRGEVSAGDET